MESNIVKMPIKTKLPKYEAACRAIAEARNVDEVKSIHNEALAIKAYAKQAKNKVLEADAIEIRLRAERRLGEMMEAQPKAKGGADRGVGRRGNAGFSKPRITLAEAGIDKNLAKRARRLNALPEDRFEDVVSEAREETEKPKRKRRILKPEPMPNLDENGNYVPSEGALGPEDFWANALMYAAGESIAITDEKTWEKQWGNWTKFKAPSQLVTLAEQAAEGWMQAASKLRKLR